MTPFILQKELKKAIEGSVSDLRFRNINGDLVPINVFEQGVPIKMNDDESEPYPYIETRIVDGEVNNDDGDSAIHIWLIIGIWNNKKDNNGTTDVLGVIMRIVERFAKDNTLEHFRQDGKIKWALQNTDTFPYYFGGMEMDFVTTAIRHQNSREDIYT